MQPVDASPARGLRRGPPLFVETDVRPTNNSSPELSLPPQYPHTRPLRAETHPYEKSPDCGDAALAERANRRQSRLNFKLFNRNRSTKKPTGQLATADEEREGESPEPQEDAVRASSAEHTLRPQPSLSKVKPTKSGKALRAPAPSETPPLFQAYPQAVLEGHLTAPAIDAETVIRMRYRQIAEAAEASPTCPAETSELSPTAEVKRDRNKINKRRTSTTTMGPVNCLPKIYILSTAGWLLQYADEGCYNRPPERIMQLTKDSAAFASDAIPGKHWVLHISQVATEAGAILEQPKTSVLSKLSFGSDMKKPVSNFLLVMNSAEEMNSWLVTIRKEIQSLGGIEYRPDEKAIGAQNKATPGQLSLDTSPANAQRKLGHRASLDCIQSPPGAGMPPSFGASRPQLGDRKISTGSTLSHRASMYAISPTGKYRPHQDYFAPLRLDVESNPMTRARTYDLDKALPARPMGVDEAQARIDALGIRNDDGFKQSQSSDDTVALGRSHTSPKFPVSAYNRDARKFSQDNGAPAPEANVRQRRFSWEKSPRTSYSPPQPASRTSHDTNATGRTRTTSSDCPSLTDGETAPQGSISGDMSSQEQLVTRSESQQEGTPSVSPAFPGSLAGSFRKHHKPSEDSSMSQSSLHTDSSTEQLSVEGRGSPEKLNLFPPSPSAHQDASPDEVHTEVPNTAIHLQPSPYPLPHSNLPGLPSGMSPPVRPSSAQDHAKRSASPQTRPTPPRRPSSCQPPTPVPKPSLSMAKSCGLPVDKPLTIQERRRLTHLPIAVIGPPPLPPPTSPLPALPTAANDSKDEVPATAPPEPPSKETSSDEHAPGFTGGASPPSPPTLAVPPPPPAKPNADIASTGHSPQIYQGEEFQNPAIPLSPVSESWKLYLDRIGAS